jgi:hypothetical protein
MALEAFRAGRQVSRWSHAADLVDPPELRWRRDPVGWATEYRGLELWSKQREILEAVRDNPLTAVHSCHETGKSWTASLATCWWLDVHPVGEARVITTAPTSKQVDAVLWYEINRMHSSLGLRGQCNLREWYVGRQLVALGRKPPDHQEAAFQGLHARYLLVILDEAYGIPRSLWDEASTLAANEYSRILAIGNPDGPGEFEANCRADSGWNVIHIGYQHTPNFTGEPVSQRLRDMLVHPKWVEERRKKWGPDSALFQSKCEGRFPTGGDPFSIIRHDWAMLCRNTEMPPIGEVEAGIDVGAGGDRTVIRERRGPVAGREDTFIDKDPMRTIGQLVERINEWGVERVKIDATGIGWALAGRLRELSSVHNVVGRQRGETTHGAEIVPIVFGAGPNITLKHKFLNRRAQIWWQTGRELSRLRGWDLTQVDDDVIHELTTPRYVLLDSYGKIKVEPKDDVIKRLGFSPDRAEALLLAFHDEHLVGEAHTTGMDHEIVVPNTGPEVGGYGRPNRESILRGPHVPVITGPYRGGRW